jgi:hypothetical protein
MNSPEDIRVETGLEVVQRPVVRGPCYLSSNYVNRLVGQGGKDDLLGLHQHQPFAHLDGHLVAADLPGRHHFDDALYLIVRRVYTRFGRLSLGLHPFPSPLQGLFQPSSFDRFEEVVDGVDLERLDGVLVEGGDEDEGG